MPTIKIDNKDFDLDKLSQEAKTQLTNIQVCDQEIQRLKIQLAIAQTARLAYAWALGEGGCLRQTYAYRTLYGWP